MPETNQQLRQAVFSTVEKAGALEEVRSIYSRLQAEIDRRKPICVASGKCCHFDSYGHRLYVTTLELAAFTQDIMALTVKRAAGPCADVAKSKDIRLQLFSAPAQGAYQDDGCPLLDGRLCGVHAIRPFGCRIFFCDPTADAWQKQQYELFHAELKQLHDRFEVPYMYVEWRAALTWLGINNEGFFL